ncbi:MAG: hypothetical protein KKB03_03160 [Nanoarchaeota archaeon]|nr:hypothetical protein [Nanoarchaeota archaeon]MBU1135811.1 hypothetical protein [Nanoarchaeota archaeon]MBU2520214.1 hypothetical protein [Nanoarchaeota archaeon]
MGIFDFLKGNKTARTKAPGVKVDKTKTSSKIYMDEIGKKITKSQKTKITLKVKKNVGKKK